MKAKLFYRLVFFVLPLAIALLILENKRQKNTLQAKATRRPNPANTPHQDTSNTDYIFFQAVSKYLYVPFFK